MEKTAVNPYGEGQVLLINKPMYWTSFDAVSKIRNLVRTKKVGHAGTLDPLATGLLIICTGKFTKRINEFMSAEKEYSGQFTLGATTPSFDLETEPVDFKNTASITLEEISRATRGLTGEIQQVPPIYSAVKKDGRRAYEFARTGKELQLEPRKVFIREFQITGTAIPCVDFRIVCSTGVYIRSLANDLGVVLGCGAYLSSLCRTRIGEFRIEQSLSMEEAEKEIREKMQYQNG